MMTGHLDNPLAFGGHLPDWAETYADHRFEAGLGLCDLGRYMSELESSLGYRPVACFHELKPGRGVVVLMNPYARRAVLRGLECEPDEWPGALLARLRKGGRESALPKARYSQLASLIEMPVLTHRPQDAGPYITAGVTVTWPSPGGRANLGVYRIQVVGPNRGLVFFDPRTDAYRNMCSWHEAGEDMPVRVLIGVHPGIMLAAAAADPVEGLSDIALAQELSGIGLGFDLDSDVTRNASHFGGAQFVLEGTVSSELKEEGPFAEFKGYYVPSRMSNVIDVQRVHAQENPWYPSIVTGSESGLTLMAMQNELRAWESLESRDLRPRHLSFSMNARAEFVAYVDTDKSAVETRDVVMETDVRCKLVVVGEGVRDAASMEQELALCPALTRVETYKRKGESYGHRIGVALGARPEGGRVEY